MIGWTSLAVASLLVEPELARPGFEDAYLEGVVDFWTPNWDAEVFCDCYEGGTYYCGAGLGGISTFLFIIL